ncbi:MAG: OFA family MFS transporter, partial [candidate division WOR-3 bacterium]|nr:OFA family MFS transporter [candidate division WOR-3 bacterium]
MKRWTVPFAGFLLALMGGFSYAWGVFVERMIERFGWTKTETALPFTIFMVVFALVMVPAGRLQDKLGPRKVSALGAILFFVAYGLASLVNYLSSVWWLIITYGIIGGTACGLTYACVAPPARKWYPDKPGLAVSFAVSGFGLAALVIAPLKARYLIPTYGIEGTFFIMGIVIFAVSLFAAWLIKNPPPDWKPKDWIHLTAKKTIAIRAEATPKEMLKSPIFYIIWSAYALIMVGGLMSVKTLPPYGEFIGLTPVQAALSISIFSGFNGFGRPLAGFLADRFGVLKVMVITYSISTLIFLIFPIIVTSRIPLYFASMVLGWSYAVT